MLATQKIIDALNEQVGMEMSASVKYDSIASHFASEGLPRLAGFFFKQATEERMHAHKFIKYILDTGGRVEIPEIPKPPHRFKFAKDAVKMALDGEYEVTRAIHNIMDAAIAEKDYSTATFLQWFISEQVEEVATMDQLLKIVERAGESGLLVVEDYVAGGGGPKAEGAMP
ncbi:MAG TPA: ferritin [Chthoniobacteraceae bacterium]|nr:ferritin [Chthoniobacteraceae bacterium]